MFFQSKSRPSQSSSSLRRGNPNSSSSQKKNTADKSDDDIDPEQFARILELLTNPKLKNILKPEIADALEDNLSVLQKTDSFEAQRCVLIQRFCLLKYGSEEKGSSLCRCFILLGFILSKNLKGL